MTKVRYGVFPQDRQWLVCSEKQHFGRFVDRSSALAIGGRAARIALAPEIDGELYIVEIGGDVKRTNPASFGH